MQESRAGRIVGSVVGLWRYPVKSMAAEALQEVDVSWNGFAGDRRWAFIRNGMTQSGFPWLTLRERDGLSHYVPTFVDPTQPDKSITVVRSPSGDIFDVTDPALATELSPSGGAQVIRQDRGIFDTFPLSVITTQTVTGLGEMVGEVMDVMRFRPNILIEAVDDEPFAEDSWVAKIIRIGGIQMRVDKRDGRCVVITIDPVTMARNPAILRAVASERQGCLGVYGTTVMPGRVALRDSVMIEDEPQRF